MCARRAVVQRAVDLGSSSQALRLLIPHAFCSRHTVRRFEVPNRKLNAPDINDTLAGLRIVAME